MSDASTTAYKAARARYAAYGIDTEAVLARLAAKPISMHCWQGDDVQGFDQGDNPASGGIMTTGNYPWSRTQLRGAYGGLRLRRKPHPRRQTCEPARKLCGLLGREPLARSRPAYV
ncbi:MAG: L-rhamnose isomerase [Olsenella sp.]|jgi:hypothetical protein|nr:L-rhamnose isomerase [Olsenella sp.]